MGPHLVHRRGVTRLWNFSQRAKGNGATATPPPPPELLDPTLGEPSEHYLARPVRPMAQLGARVGLWSAVVLGCLGGLVGLAGPSDEGPPPVVEQSEDEGFVPAPVAGMAETAVEEWLAPGEPDEDEGESDGERLDELFIERPSTTDVEAGRLSVQDITTVAGHRLDDGYWTVTVAAEVVEIVDDVAQPATVWYVDVGIVGDPEGGLAALTTPAVVPAPPGVSTDLRPSAPLPGPPAEDDPVAGTVEGFLNALLAGDGDPSRYLAPRVTMTAANPAPFVDVELLEMAVEEVDRDQASEQDPEQAREEEGDIRIWATVRGTTAGESSQVLAYELVAVERVDRWEILELSGAQTVERSEEREQREPSSDEPAEDPDEDTTTTGADGGSEGEGSEDQGTEGEVADDTSEDGGTGEPTASADPPSEETSTTETSVFDQGE